METLSIDPSTQQILYKVAVFILLICIGLGFYSVT